jgi:hypothetical protein
MIMKSLGLIVFVTILPQMAMFRCYNGPEIKDFHGKIETDAPAPLLLEKAVWKHWHMLMKMGLRGMSLLDRQDLKRVIWKH